MIRAFGVSDAGRVRRINEDAFVVDTDVGLCAVCDGMGGHKAGEVASRLAVEALGSFIRRSASDIDFSWPFGIDQALSVDGNRLRTSIHLANRRVFKTAESSDEYSGMGATVVAVLLNQSQIVIGHVGDSRAYVLAGGRFEQVTVDDSLASALAHESGLAPSEIAKHPMRNVLTNVLGAREHVSVHLSERTLGRKETLLLCSDGLHGTVDIDTLREIVDRTPDVEAAARCLVTTALDRGSRDNVTAIVVHHEADQ